VGEASNLGAIALSGQWTYNGDRLRLSFRDLRQAPGESSRYKVCWTRRSGLGCQARRIFGPRWRTTSLLIRPSVGTIGARRVYVDILWFVNGERVKRTRWFIFQ